MAVIHKTVIDELAEFLTSSPSLEQLAEYHLSDAADAWISHLLDLNRNGKLGSAEQKELDDYMVIEHLMRRVKSRALEKLTSNELHS